MECRKVDAPPPNQNIENNPMQSRKGAPPAATQRHLTRRANQRHYSIVAHCAAWAATNDRSAFDVTTIVLFDRRFGDAIANSGSYALPLIS
jgi:hypothetical protein